MFKKLLIPIVLLTILMPIAFAYGGGYSFTGDYSGTAMWIYHSRNGKNRVSERALDNAVLRVIISDDGKLLTVELNTTLKGTLINNTIAIKHIYKNKRIIFVRATYKYFNKTSDGTRTLYRCVVTLIIKGSDHKVCKMYYFMVHYEINRAKHSRYIETLRLIFNSETAEYPR